MVRRWFDDGWFDDGWMDGQFDDGWFDDGQTDYWMNGWWMVFFLFNSLKNKTAKVNGAKLMTPKNTMQFVDSVG